MAACYGSSVVRPYGHCRAMYPDMKVLNRRKNPPTMNSLRELPMSVPVLDSAGEVRPILHTLVSAPGPADGANELSPTTVLTALTVEEPLPLLVVEMSIWSLGVSAGMISWSVFSVIASPMIMAYNALIPRAKFSGS